MAARPSRREFLHSTLATGASVVMAGCAAPPRAREPTVRLSVFTDEISQDLAHALDVARELKLNHVELRGMWGKNIIALDDREIDTVLQLLDERGLRVSSIAGPLFKVDWPGAPRSRFSPEQQQFGASFTFEQQEHVLERSLALAHRFGTDHVRCFDFWRLDDCAPFRAAIDQRLRAAADRAAEQGITLVMENEYECNSSTLAETLHTLDAVRSEHFKLNFDPGNAAFAGEVAYPDFYAALPSGRVGHVHCKDVVRKADGGYEWTAVGRGMVDFVGLFRALARDGYRGAVVLETHWQGGGAPEAASRQSMAGLKEALRQAAVSWG
ncbi:MAG: sugar phosphate isomerase/epimerase family protein [Planctomycetota bacterium]